MTIAATLADAIAAQDNNYLDLAAAFTARTGHRWHDPTPPALGAGTAVSVVIPARNNGYSLRHVLRALEEQDTAGTIEVIVIDDASTDDTPSIVRNHRTVDRAYRLPRQLGPAQARNVGTHLATADTVLYLDADMVLPSHVLADFGARAQPELVLVGFRHNIPFQYANPLPTAPASLESDHRARWEPPAHKPMFYSGQIYDESFVGRPLDDTHDFVSLGHGGTYYDWDLPRMFVTALVSGPRAKVIDVGGFDPAFDEHGWGTEDTHLGAALIAAGCKVAPLRQAVGYHIDPPDAAEQWQAKFATARARIEIYRRLLGEPAPGGQCTQLADRAEALLRDAERLR